MDPSTVDDTYELAGECLLHPSGRDRERMDVVRERLRNRDADWVTPLVEAADADGIWSAREYVETLELAPPCPLYVGTYLFDEPETCRGAAVSDRNPYLMQLENLYRHFGIELIDGELPDFLPVMLDFLRMTDREGDARDLSVRKYFVRDFLQPGLEPMHEKMIEYESPYARVLETVREAVDRELASMADVRAWEPDDEIETQPGPSCADRLDASSLPCCNSANDSNRQRASSEEWVR